MNEIINAKVAAIIDDTILVLNAGSRDGVLEGMVFMIFAEHQAVEDPDSGEPLGQWEMVKARVVVTHVQERMCTVRAPLVAAGAAPSNTRTLSSLMVEHSLGSYGRGAEKWDHLQVRSADVSGQPKGQPIAVGDQARALPLHKAEEGPPAAASKPDAGDDAPGQS
jgi:hypothetical protein